MIENENPRSSSNNPDFLTEQSDNGIECIDLLHADPPTIARFGERVDPLHGRLQVLVHPFYSDVEQTKFTTDHRYVTQQYITRRDKLLRAFLSHNLPLLVFQPQESLPELPQTLRKYGKGSIYTVETEMSKHMPIGGEESWGKLIKILKAASIDHVILGGMYLMTYKSEIASFFDRSDIIKDFLQRRDKFIERYPRAARWLKQDLISLGCVGHAAIHFLKSGIDISFSSVATPNSGQEYRPMIMASNDDDF